MTKSDPPDIVSIALLTNSSPDRIFWKWWNFLRTKWIDEELDESDWCHEHNERIWFPYIRRTRPPAEPEGNYEYHTISHSISQIKVSHWSHQWFRSRQSIGKESQRLNTGQIVSPTWISKRRHDSERFMIDGAPLKHHIEARIHHFHVLAFSGNRNWVAIVCQGVWTLRSVISRQNHASSPFIPIDFEWQSQSHSLMMVTQSSVAHTQLIGHSECNRLWSSEISLAAVMFRAICHRNDGNYSARRCDCNEIQKYQTEKDLTFGKRITVLNSNLNSRGSAFSCLPNDWLQFQFPCETQW
jgi:hypothetical protein